MGKTSKKAVYKVKTIKDKARTKPSQTDKNPSFYKNDERLVGSLERLQKEINDLISGELYRTGIISNDLSSQDSQEKYLNAKKMFLEESQAIRTFQSIQKDLTKTLAIFDDIRGENSEQILDIYCRRLGVEPNTKEDLEKSLESLKNGPKSDSGETQTSPAGLSADLAEGIDSSILDSDNLEKLYRSGNTKALLKKLMESQLAQQKAIKKILAKELVENNSTFNIPQVENGSIGLKLIDSAEKKEGDESIKSAELQVSLDIPSIRIKEKFNSADELTQKIKQAEKKKSVMEMLGLVHEPDDKTKLNAMVLDNLKKACVLKDERKRIIAISYILRQFLEVKFRITKSLTYSEIILEIQSKDIDPYLKTNLKDLFTKLPDSVYRGAPLDLSPESCLDLAQKTVQKLGPMDFSKKPNETAGTTAQTPMQKL
jgi:hypothetical protein